MNLEEQYQATIPGFAGVPVIPKVLAEKRIVALQEEKDALDPSSEDYAEIDAKFAREIQDMHDALSSGNVTEDEQEIRAFFEYNKGLRDFLLENQ